MSIESMYKKASRVWISHPNKVWESAIILEDYNSNQNSLYVQVDDSRETKILMVGSSAELPPLCLPEDSCLDIQHNLSSLTVIHEATILYQLRSRFEQRCQYSYCGISAIALNPYTRLSENESDEILNYRNSTLKNLSPHIFGIAENVYIKLEREHCDQAIVFTGESGAGKSFNAERAILYLTTISSKEDQVKEKILASSVILQAFGHASTAINENSSRFGKFVQLQYDRNYHVTGALLTTYNFDRSSIVSQEGHRKFLNIFYYLNSAKKDLSHLQLNECQFDYLESKDDLKACNVRNKKYFDETIEAFNVLGFSEKDQNDILKILVVLLHLQSIVFKKVRGMKTKKTTETCSIADLNQFKMLGKVLGLDEQLLKDMRKWMCYKRTFCDRDEILQLMNSDQVLKARNSLATFMYTKLFSWLVTRINASFRAPCHVQSFIGILDMHGFEKLDSNSLEQFCINYIDEKVEQLFIQSYFKLEQEEYAREKIDWTFMSFADNMPCVELIEGKLGILDLLEEETKTSSDNILIWLENLHTKFDKSQNFEKSTENIAEFTIHHFICSVQYDAIDFLAKNYESVPKEQLEVLKETKIELLKKFIMDEISKRNISKVERRSSTRKRTSKRASFSFKPSKKTVTSELRASLTALTAALSKTKPYFVRCIKSNDQKKPFTFDSQRVVKQLRAFSVVQTTRISAVGYFQQRCYKDFARRYHCLSHFEDVKSEDKQEVCEKILSRCRENDHVKFGKTKIFLREDTIDCLENLRAEKRRCAAVSIQKSVRRFLQQKAYNELRRLTYGIQRYTRGYLIRQRIEAKRDRMTREHLAATKIQACFRGYLHRRRFLCIKHRLPVPQAHTGEVRQHLGRHYSKDVAATIIQKNVKSFLARRNYIRTRKNIVVIQSCVRRFLDMMKLKKLKAQNDLRFKVLNQSDQKNLDSLRKRIDCLMSMHLSTKDLMSVHSIIDNKECLQTKNRILNDLLITKIKTLQDLRENQKPCGIPQNSQSHLDSCTSEHHGINWRMYDKPIVEQYDNEALYQKLVESFQKVDRDAKTLQQTAGIEDEEILKLMESYRNSIQATKNAEISANDTPQQDDCEDTKLCKGPIPITVEHRTDPRPRESKTQQLEISDVSLDTDDPSKLGPFLKSDIELSDEGLFIFDDEYQRNLDEISRTNHEDTEVSKGPIWIKVEDCTDPRESENQQVEISNVSHGTEEYQRKLDERSTNHEDTEVSKEPIPIIVEQSTDPCQSENQQVEMSDASLGTEEYQRNLGERNRTVPPEIPTLELEDLHLKKRKRFQIMCGDESEKISTPNIAYDGMFEFDLTATESLTHYLTELSPAMFIENNLPSDLPAQILMMCIRYTDYKKDHQATLSLLRNFTTRATNNVEIEGPFHVKVFWLLNTYQMLNYLKQYSKTVKKESQEFQLFHANNTAQQNKQRLQKFDLRGAWDMLEETCRQQANFIIKDIISCEIASYAVIALLCTEEVYDFNAEPGTNSNRKIDILLKELTRYHDTFVKYSYNRQIVIQIFKPIFDHIGSTILNKILSRSNLCSTSRGLRIGCNLRILECWIMNRQLSPVIQELMPLIQAVRLIQLQPLSIKDISNIYENYDKLSCSEILKIVELYNANCLSIMPLCYNDMSVSSTIINELKSKIEDREEMDSDTLPKVEKVESDEYPVEFPFRHSTVKLEELEIPQICYLPMMLRKI